MANRTPAVLVTGGAGFIGSNIVAHFAPLADVVVCDWLKKDERWRNLAKHDIADLVAPEDLSDFLAVRGDELDAIVHMGAISATTECDVDAIVRNNFALSRYLWRWCTEYACRFIYASSAATYGSGDAGFLDDQSPAELARLRPLNAYGWSKLLFDRHVARSLAGDGPHPPQWAGLKFFNVYGPNEYHKGEMASVISKIFPRVQQGETVRLFRSHHPDYEDGGQLRDFIYVADCVRAVEWLLQNEEVSGLFNLGTGKARSFTDLARAVFAALDREPAIEYIDTPLEIRDRYQYFTQAEMAKLKDAGYGEAFTELEDGVVDYVQNYLATDDPYR